MSLFCFLRHAINFFSISVIFYCFPSNRKKMVYPTISISLFFLDCDTQKSSTFYVDFSSVLFLLWISGSDSPSHLRILFQSFPYAADRYLSTAVYTVPLLLFPDILPIHVLSLPLYCFCFLYIYLWKGIWNMLPDYFYTACIPDGWQLYMKVSCRTSN